MDFERSIAALNKPVRRRVLEWLKGGSDFPPALPEHAGLDGVWVARIREKAKLSQFRISTCMGLLGQAGFVTAERRGQWPFCRRDEAAIRAFLNAMQGELLKHRPRAQAAKAGACERNTAETRYPDEARA
ncbi:hypothetical protein LNKW23_32080 [Paralimibaculum aggregatum]|uniref:Transcriptional regulator n=1 Tax=Paralimibaculum aggregatum TaxID=3036245 RepID=A0ABQ6LNU7_9RHOB|nr:transcriptional regulator [Limibaculum sp. NKW23]GMG83994.1 hypothetical protein LNKW23_32080 [Limibaculum sp. NKW23]